MAAGKKAASTADVDKVIVAFALREHVEGDGDEAVSFKEGQRLDLSKTDFDALAKAGVCAEGVYVKMKTAIQGGQYNLRAGSMTWLSPKVYAAWKAAGYCEPTSDDPEVSAILKAREDAVREAASQRDIAMASLAEAQSKVSDLALEMAAAKAQAQAVAEAASEILDGDAETFEPVKVELQKLIDMFPDQISAEPELALS
ncbi:hypothetical protein ACN2XU_02715 [Primorskyibacter sp. 2E107]|uniref:hypothetical protein n=1 Tax=Primorskyibacter sp. 2E107 TaxID=3403458 RepID=UPI003AF52C2B